MKKIIIIFTIFMFSQNVFAEELQGGISYDVNSARQYVQAGQVDYIGPASSLYFNSDYTPNCDIIYGYYTNGNPRDFTVRYKDNLMISYTYNMANKLQFVDKYDKPSTEYPHRTYRYDTKGKLVMTCLITSKGNGFTFTTKGKLIAKLINNVAYLGNTNIVIGSQSNY